MQKITAIISLFSVSASVVDAVALSDFRPSTAGLTSTCNRAYQAQIPGCQNSDFTGGTGCSNSCIQGLLQTNLNVASDCQNANVASNSIIGIFLAGKGIRALCNIEVVTKTLGSSQSPAPISTSATASISTPTPAPPPLSPPPLPSTISLSTPPTTSSNSTTTRISSTSSSSSASSMITQTATVASQSAGPTILPKCSGSGQGGSPFDQVPGKECVNAGVSLTLSLMLSLICLFVSFLVQNA